MQDEFHKALQTFQTYQTNSRFFIAQIQKGTPNLLPSLITCIQSIIISQTEPPLTKVLSMRFCKDIMILGRSDVINSLTSLLPLMIQICQYKHESESVDRGETIFTNHKEYLKADEEEKREIELYGSTYFTLTLESILHWAKWIPADENGNQSPFSIAYTNLLKKGVHFNYDFHYYKQSDTQRFQNIFKMEFFSESSFFDSSSSLSKSSSKNKFQSQLEAFSRQMNTVQKIRNSLNEAAETKETYDRLQIIYNNLLSLLGQKYESETKKFNGEELDEKKWIEKYIINYGLLTHSQINFEQFMKKISIELVNLSIQEQNLSEKNYRPAKICYRKKKNFIQEKLSPEDAQKQNSQMKASKNGYEEKEVGKCEKNIKNVQRKKEQLEEKNYHKEIKNKEGAYNDVLRENKILQEKLGMLEKVKQNYEENLDQTNKLKEVIEKFKEEKEKFISHEDKQKYLQTIQELELRLQQQKRRSKELLLKEGREQMSDESDRKQKKFQNLNDELKIYKNQLHNERQRLSKKSKYLQQKLTQLETENRVLKERVSKLEKKLDLRDIEAEQLTKQINLYKAFDKQVNMNQEEERQSHRCLVERSPDKTLKEISLKYKKYERLRNRMGGKQEELIRFCRCSLKRKDILFKENELQIGLITKFMAPNSIEFILHFSNMSQTQFENIEISIKDPKPVDLYLNTQFIFCIQRQEQQKIIITCQNLCQNISDEYHPLLIHFSYEKNKKYNQNQLHLPFLPYKALSFSEIQIKPPPIAFYQKFKVRYSRKMLSEVSSIKKYFPSILQTSQNKYEVDCLCQRTNIPLKITFQFVEGQEVWIQVTSFDEARKKEKQQLIYDIISFLEFAFKR